MPFGFDTWCELIDDTQVIEVSEDAVRCITTASVDADDYEDALEFMLPLVSVQVDNQASDVKLQRKLPPRFPGKGAIGDNFVAHLTRVSTTGAGGQDAVRVPAIGLAPPYHRYPKYRFEMEWESLPYNVRPDTSVQNAVIFVGQPGVNVAAYYPEWVRNVIWNFKPVAELLTLEGASLQFCENPDGGVPQVRGHVIPGVTAVLETKGVIQLVWKDVPADFVLDEKRVPTVFQLALGKVNSAEFLGYPRGTLGLFDAPEFTVKPYGIYDPNYIPTHNWLYDIKFQFRWFDPVKGNDTSDYRGHNLLPVKGQNYYLYATRVPFNVTPVPGNEDATRDPLFTYFDFRELFQYVGYA